MAPYRPKSLDELNQAYDKTKAQQPASRPAPQAQQQPARSIADTVRARENKEALSGAVDDFIKQFSAKEPAPSAYTQAQQMASTPAETAAEELAKETNRAFDDVLSFPEIKMTPPEPPAYHRYTHEEAPIKEGDLSGLMDEYIAVMTDQNGEEENRRSFLRRRKERKKNRQPQHLDSEASGDLFDLPAAEAPAPAAPPVETPPAPAATPYVAPVTPVAVPFEEPVAPVEIPVEEPVAPVEIPFEEPVAPAEIPFEEPVAPVEIPFEEPVASVEIPFEEPVAPVEIPFEEPVTPVEIPFEEPVAPVEIPVEETVAPVEIPFEEPVVPEEIPVEEPVAPVEIPVEEPVIPEEIPFEEPVTPVEIPFEEPVTPEEMPVEEPVIPEEPPVEAPAPEPIVPQVPEYTPYRSPLEDQPIVPAAPKPKKPINMEPEPVFDPHRLFSDLDDEEAEPDVLVEPIGDFAPEAPAIEEEILPAAEAFPAPEEVPAEPPVQEFEDVVSYSDETQDDRFTPQAEAEAPAEEPEAPAQEQPQDDEELDLAALDLQQEVVIRPSKVKVFFKVLVTLLILLSLLATAAVGLTKLLNINTGKSAVGDYYFFAVSNDYANVDIHGGDLILAKRKLPLDVGDRAVYVDPDTRSFSFGKNEASSADPDLYNALLYNLSGIVVREENVLGVVQTTVPQGGTVVRAVLANYNTYLLVCLGVFVFLLLIRVIFLRKKRRYLTIEELAQQQEAAAQKKSKKEKPQKAKKAKKESAPAVKPAAPAAPPAGEETDLFSDID